MPRTSPRNRQLLLLGEVPSSPPPATALQVALARQAAQEAAARVSKVVGKAPLFLHLSSSGSRPTLELFHGRKRILRTGRPLRALPAIGDPLGWPLYWNACWCKVRREVGCLGCHYAPCRCEALAEEEREQLDLLSWMAHNPVFGNPVDDSGGTS